MVLFCRIVGGLAGLADGLILGGNDPLWPLAAAVTVLVTLPIARALLTRHVGAPGLLAMIALDSLPILAAWALSGPETQRALVPVVALLPVVWAFVVGPRIVVAVSVGNVAGFAVFEQLGAAGASAMITAVWATAVGVLISTVGSGLGRQLRDAAIERNRALQLVMEGEEGERRRLAADLHDDALQLLLAARQDLVEAAEGDPDGAAYALHALDEADAALQYVLSDLDLDLDEHAAHVEGGLLAALEQLAVDVHLRRRGPVVTLAVDPLAAGRRDGLLVRVTRELLANVVRHATASAVSVTVESTDDGVRLEIADDGVGFDRGRVDDATRRGHVGLASIAERVREVGGSTDLLDVTGGGALVRVVVPTADPPVGAVPLAAA